MASQPLTPEVAEVNHAGVEYVWEHRMSKDRSLRAGWQDFELWLPPKEVTGTIPMHFDQV